MHFNIQASVISRSQYLETCNYYVISTKLKYSSSLTPWVFEIYSFTALILLLFQAYFIFKTFSIHLSYIFHAFNMHGKYVYPEKHVNFKLQEWTPTCIQENQFPPSFMIIIHEKLHCAEYCARF